MKKIIKSKYLSLAVLALLITQTNVLFADNNQTKETTPEIKAVQQRSSWLGVTLSNIPPVLSAQLSDLIPKGQGVLIGSVSKDSPAEKAGLKVNDVLLSLNDQKLYSAKQLSGLIHAIKPKTEVSFKIVSKGKLMDTKVVLGERETQNSQQSQSFNSPSWLAPQLPKFGNNSIKQQGNVLGSFESVQVQTIGNGRYRAEVTYKNTANESKQFSFEGKKEEIIEQVKKQKDLPSDKKQSLINALNMNFGVGDPMQAFQGINSPFNQPFFKQFNQPFGGMQGHLFQDPFFGGSLFNDPFFQNGFANTPLFLGIPQIRMIPNPRYQIQQPSMPRRQIAPQPQGNTTKESLI